MVMARSRRKPILTAPSASDSSTKNANAGPLLASAVTLAWQLGISPLFTPWLAAKVVALLLYIALGTVALKRGKTRRIRLIAWLTAQLVFFYMVSVAITHDPALGLTR